MTNNSDGLPKARLLSLDALREQILPQYLSPIPTRQSLRKWFRTVPKFKANPLSQRGGGTVYYSVDAVTKILKARTGLRG
jgi:hypothetical protein